MFDRCLDYNASAPACLIEREWAAVYADFGSTPAQGHVPRIVQTKPGCRGTDIAATAGIARPTATRLIDCLSDKQLVERRRGISDGREWGVYATRRQGAAKIHRGREHAADASLTREDRAGCRRQHHARHAQDAKSARMTQGSDLAAHANAAHSLPFDFMKLSARGEQSIQRLLLYRCERDLYSPQLNSDFRRACGTAIPQKRNDGLSAVTQNVCKGRGAR
ncbi:MarR family transcriptional regulator [Paraburkholderia bengalensis]|uniref:MarR family transcriptional regulator n=1 Tax=Paraburkholderia bengalensis TaxID=2747562 RepID=A0ABU8IKK6_9BURK